MCCFRNHPSFNSRMEFSFVIRMHEIVSPITRKQRKMTQIVHPQNVNNELSFPQAAIHTQPVHPESETVRTDPVSDPLKLHSDSLISHHNTRHFPAKTLIKQERTETKSVRNLIMRLQLTGRNHNTNVMKYTYLTEKEDQMSFH